MLLSYTHTAVSYTHLDVYKRQHFTLFEFPFYFISVISNLLFIFLFVLFVLFIFLFFYFHLSFKGVGNERLSGLQSFVFNFRIRVIQQLHDDYFSVQLT